MLDRSIAPEYAELGEIKLPQPTISQLNADWEACVLHDARHAVVVIELIFANGRWWESQRGSSYFAAKMLSEGTASQSSSEISMAFARYGSYLEIIPGFDFVTVRLHALKKHFRPSMELLVHILGEPSFPDEEFETLKRIRKANLRNQLARNNQMANAQFSEALFGTHHPYGQMITPEVVDLCTKDLVQEEYRSSFFNRPKVMMSGDVDGEISWVQGLLANINTRNINNNHEALIPKSSRANIERDGTQCSIRMGSPTINRRDEDIFKLTIATRLLGGFFGSRLMKNIREEKGLTYGIYAHLVHFARGSYWVIGSEVSKADSELAENEIRSEIAKLATDPPSDEELTLLRNYSRGKMLGEIDSPLSLASLYKAQFLLGISLDYHEQYLRELENISAKQLSEMIGKYFDTENCTVVTVA